MIASSTWPRSWQAALVRGMASVACVAISLGLALATLAQAETPARKAVTGRLAAHVSFLAAPEQEGRGAGSPGLARCRDYVREAFEEIGLEVSVQPFRPSAADAASDRPPAVGAWGEVELSNVVGVLRGSEPGRGAIVLAAHYDHLGRDASGATFAGADDNASGVALLIELARALKAETSLRRDLVFLATSGEEAGLLGAKAYVGAPVVPLEQTIAMLNFDTVGRMSDRKLYLLGVSSASEWTEILRSVNLGFQFDLVMPEKAPFASDQTPFFERGVPVVHVFTGPNSDYHRISDLPEKLDLDALGELVDYTREVAIFLADREQRLTFVPPGAAEMKPMSGGGAPRRVSLGTIPDFKQTSGGVLLSGVTPGSPAEQVGLKAGDVLVELDGVAIDNLGDFTDVLKAHQPGDVVSVRVKRGEEILSHQVTLVERK